MTELDKELISPQATTAGDAEAVRHLEQAIIGGKQWYIALLEAMGLWSSTEETHNARTYRYLIEGEAFDWLLLAERLCQAVGSLLPAEEMKALIFHGKPPLSLSPEEVKRLIGSSKYRQYLNYFYGITVESALLLAVQEEVHKEKWLLGGGNEDKTAHEAYRRIYGDTEAALLKRFRQERGYPQRQSITLTKLKEFTYWLFKYRLSQSEKARVASDTKKALDYLKRQWAHSGLSGALAIEDSFANRP